MLSKGKPKVPISVLFLINSLGNGGAEAMLYRVISNLDRRRFRPQAVALIDVHTTYMADKIRALGIPVRSLGMRPGKPNPMSLLQLTRWLRQDPPDIIQTWQYYADLAGGLAARLAGDIPVVWGIRHSDLSTEGNKRILLLTAKICARLSRWFPDRIVCCSEASHQVHTALGYAPEKMVVIPNGYDIESFKPDPVARELVRKELQIPQESPVIGLVARFHILKDHRNFVRAASLLHRDRPDVHFVLCGYGVTWENRELVTWIEEAGVRSRCHLLGLRDDIPKLTAAVDIACLSSSGEAFPNVVSEAMSCSVPCVVTDVGDAALIVGETGLVVPPKNPAALAEAWREMLDLGPEGRSRLGMAARERVKEKYSLSQIVNRYQDLYEELHSSGPEKIRSGGHLFGRFRTRSS